MQSLPQHSVNLKHLTMSPVRLYWSRAIHGIPRPGSSIMGGMKAEVRNGQIPRRAVLLTSGVVLWAGMPWESALRRVQDQPTGLWYQVLDQGDRKGNYLEASASCMVVYAMAKGVRNGYLDKGYLDLARGSYQSVLEHFAEVDDRGLVKLRQICSVAGLGGMPYRDGSFDYYISEPVVTNDYKGVGPFILASVEMERLK